MKPDEQPETGRFGQNASDAAQFLRMGLTDAEAMDRQAEFGPNRLPEARKASMASIFVIKFGHTQVFALLGAAALIAAFGDARVCVALLLIVLANAVIGTAREWRPNSASDSIAKLAAPYATVRRGGEEKKIPSEEIVVGDIVLLSGGMPIPADVVVVDCEDFVVDESALAGMRALAKKAHGPQSAAYGGTTVAAGWAECIVVATGAQTRIGSVAEALDSAGKPDAPLQKRFDRTADAVSLAAIAAATTVCVVGLVARRPASSVFAAASAVIVAAIPEAAAAVAYAALAIAKNRLARVGASVRHLPSIEPLGNAQIIVADKTGVFTQNRMVVRRIWTENMPLLQACMLHCNDVVCQSAFDGSPAGEKDGAAAAAGAAGPGLADAWLGAGGPAGDVLAGDVPNGAAKTGAELAGVEAAGAEKAGAGILGVETMGAEKAGAGLLGVETMGAETAGAGLSGTETAGAKPSGSGQVAVGSAGAGQAVAEPAAYGHGAADAATSASAEAAADSATGYPKADGKQPAGAHKRMRDELRGEQSETALLEYLLANGSVSYGEIRARARVGEIPYDGTRKVATVAVRITPEDGGQDGTRVYVRGDPAAIAERCTHVQSGDNIDHLSSDGRARIRARCDDISEHMPSVVAFAYRDYGERWYGSFLDIPEPETGLVFVGAVGMADPARADARAAIERCRDDRLAVAMVTGDPLSAAIASAEEIGILHDGVRPTQELHAHSPTYPDAPVPAPTLAELAEASMAGSGVKPAAEALGESGAHAGSEAHPKSGAKPNPIAQAESGAQAGSEAHPKSGTKPGPIAQAESGAQTGSETNPKSGAKPGPIAQAESGAKPVSAAQTQPGSRPKPESESKSDSEAGSKPDYGPESESESETASEFKSDFESEPEADLHASMYAWHAFDGAALDAMDDDALAKVVTGISVYAELLPEHRTRVVGAWQRDSSVVAITGIGAADAPAMQAADAAIGLSSLCSPVALAAADVTLSDDSFAGLAAAMAEARRAVQGSLVAAQYMLACGIGASAAALVSAVGGWPLLTPSRALLLNVVLAGLPALSLAALPCSIPAGAAKLGPKANLLDKRGWMQAAAFGCAEAALACAAFFVSGGGSRGENIAFCTLVAAHLLGALGIWLANLRARG